MAIWEQWSTDPSQNNATPPLGAPEGGTPLQRVSDICRYVMAGVAELGALITALGSMAAQDADDVAITGGSVAGSAVSGAVATATNALQFGGRSRQQAYDDIWPVGSERGWNSTNLSGLTPSGLTATWVQVGADCLLVAAGEAYPAGQQAGAGTDATAASAGAHTPAGTISRPTLSGTTDLVGAGAPDYTVYDVDGLTVSIPTFTGAAVAAHTHAITLPKRYATVWVRRTA